MSALRRLLIRLRDQALDHLRAGLEGCRGPLVKEAQQLRGEP
jgi:hypothetical protein